MVTMQRNHKCDICKKESETLRPLRTQEKIVWACEDCRKDKSKSMRQVENESKESIKEKVEDDNQEGLEQRTTK